MRHTDIRLISKVGAGGVYTAGVLPSQDWPYGLGIAIKIEDGEDRRARPTVVIEALCQLDLLSNKALGALAPYATLTLQNLRGDTVGSIYPKFKLVRN